MSDQEQNQNVAIIGGGVNGAALALRLAQQGKEVTVYEKLPEKYFSADLFETVDAEGRGHSINASAVADQTTRSLRFMWERLDHPLEAVTDTRDLFLEVQKQFPDQKFVTGHPSVMLIHPDDSEMLEGMKHQVERVAKTGAKMEVWDGADAGDKLRAKYPALKDYELPEGTIVVHEEGYDPEKNPNGVSAMVNPAAYLRALHQLVKKEGVNIQYDSPVEKLAIDDAGKAAITSGENEKHFDHAVVTAGGWSKDILAQVDGLKPLIEETPKRVRWTDVLDADAAEAVGTVPFIQPESLTAETGRPYRTLMPATVQGEAKGVKLLYSEKKKFKNGADDLAKEPTTPAEIAEDRKNFEEITGLSTSKGGGGQSCMITATPDKMMTAGNVERVDGGKSPISAISACSYASFVVGGAAIESVAAQIDGRQPPYRDWDVNHAPNRDITVSKHAAEERSLEVEREQSKGRGAA